MPALPSVEKVGQRQDVTTRGIIIAVCATVVALALINVSPEFSANKARIEGALGPYRFNLGQLERAVWSAEGIYAKLNACDAALSAIVTKLQPSAQRVAVAQDCHVFSSGVLQQAPAMSFAHLVKALALDEIGQSAKARSALLLSEMTTSNTVLYAQRRAALWIKYFPVIPPPEQAALTRDFARLAATQVGTSWIAGQYKAVPSMRAFISTAIQTMPEPRQKTFLAAIRKLNQ